jgi:hypothetical protein
MKFFSADLTCWAGWYECRTHPHTGTGKTTMTIALLSILASTCSPRAFVHGGASLHDAAHVQRLLCTAPTNVAVQEIATRFVHTFLEGI